jgi:Ca2+-binding RTX toxin-like protein
MSRKHTARRRFQFEGLEARQLMAADLYLDFGAAFSWNASQGQHLFQVEMLDDNRVNGPSATSVPGRLNSLYDAMMTRGIDYDLNGSVNTTDADILMQDVADMVSRVYEPFDVNVKIVGSANMNQVIDKLDDHATNDAYVFVAGRHEDAGNFGIARVNTGNTKDNVAFAYAENLLDKATSLVSDGAHPWSYIVQAMARTAAHEAAHTFGLKHLLEESEGLTDDQMKLAIGDIMFTDDADSGTYKYINLAHRWNGLPTADGTQNAYEVLAANVGLRAGGPAYVTGTGANDVIRIEGIAKGQAFVTVSAYRDVAHTDLIETQSYTINTTNGILVEAGRRNDLVEIVSLNVPVILRGGQGDDVLNGSGNNDTLEGDTGSDMLLGAAGSDVYLFRGPRFQDLNRDTIDDSSGTDDVLDFSALGFAANVDLASTNNQAVDYAPPTYTTFRLVPGPFGYEVRMVTLPYESRLDLDLKTGTGSTGIENVRGTRFDDRIYGNELDNDLFGNAGNDLIYGYDGLDVLSGGWGNDKLYGGAKRDLLYGEAGRDEIFGELGDDYLDGGYDGYADTMNGGEGADEFVQYYRWGLASSTTPGSPITQVYELLEAEILADFNANLGDKLVKRIGYLRLV